MQAKHLGAGMSEPKAGVISWHDLTVTDAGQLRDFYAAVTGWDVEPVAMGDYDDYCMVPPGADAPVAGICHARGANAELPPQWLMYVTVENLDQSLAECRARGGEAIGAIRSMGADRYCVVRDPVGAVLALYQKA